VVGVPKLSLLSECTALFIVIWLSTLASWVVFGVTEPVTTITGVAWIGAAVYCIVKAYRRIKSLLGVICHGPDRCITAPGYEIALIYVEPGEKSAKQGETS
jgi:hypothetical protein